MKADAERRTSKIIAIGLLTAHDLERLGTGLKHVYPIDETPVPATCSKRATNPIVACGKARPAASRLAMSQCRTFRVEMLRMSDRHRRDFRRRPGRGDQRIKQRSDDSAVALGIQGPDRRPGRGCTALC